MCGISGITRRDEALITRMNQLVKHRGPDGDGVFVDDQVSLGHVRLAIIDPTTRSDQPMLDRERQVVLIFNGEIYNFKALRHELSSSYAFETSSDTEVILAGYKVWGTEVFNRLNGIFAIAIWDTRTQTLYLARDQRGVKPLYYHHDKNELVFSSEVKALLAAGVPSTLHSDALQYYMRLRYVPGEQTLFAAVKQVKPGELVTYRKGTLTRTELNYTSLFSLTDPKPTVRETIAAAVARQVISDKPVGVFLSGGLDSTIVTYEARKHISNLQAYSTWFVFDDNKAYSDDYNYDAQIAAQTAAGFGINHQMVEIRPEDVVANFEKLVWHNDVPVPSLTMLSQYKIAQAAKHDVDVALGGDGGDEYFGGYTRYRYAYWMQQYQKLPYLLRSLAGKIIPIGRKLNVRDPIALIEQFSMEKSRELTPVFKGYQPAILNQFLRQYLDHAPREYHQLLTQFDRDFWLPDYSLVRSDKLSMAHGVELRVPLLDLEIAAVAATLSNRQKFGFTQSKKILREQYQDVLPHNVLTAPKSGWISPGSKWLRNPAVREFMLQILSAEYYKETAQLFDWDMVQKYYVEHCDTGPYHYNVLLSIATFQVWARQFKVTL